MIRLNKKPTLSNLNTHTQTLFFLTLLPQSKENLQVMAGSNHWNEGQRMRVLSTLIHPHYDKRRFLNDIALLRLESVTGGSMMLNSPMPNSPMLLGSLRPRPLLGSVKLPVGSGARSGWRSGGDGDGSRGAGAGFGRIGRRSVFWSGRSNRTDDHMLNGSFSWQRSRMWRSLQPAYRSSGPHHGHSDRWAMRRLHRKRLYRPLSFRRQSPFENEIYLRTFRALPASIKVPESYMQFKGNSKTTKWPSRSLPLNPSY